MDEILVYAIAQNLIQFGNPFDPSSLTAEKNHRNWIL
jgi:hypothetical protein